MRQGVAWGLVAGSAVLLALFQNCSRAGIAIQESSKAIDIAGAAVDTLAVCNGVSCDLSPLTSKPAVTTILMAIGDEADDQLVVNGSSAQLIAETVIRYSSPKENPKILVVRDYRNGGEDPEDTYYVANNLLKRFDTHYLEEDANGLSASDLNGYDVVWFNNPGHVMGSVNSRDALLNFAGAVVLQGDDLSAGNGFSMESLTGLKFVDNGVSVKCNDGVSYPHNDNNGYRYRVALNSSKFGGVASSLQFEYGNDIDETVVARSGLEILATAKGGPSSCTSERPAIVRYLK